MEHGLTPGLVGRTRAVVTQSMTAAAVGSGLVAGLATPTMVALMESASIDALSGMLPPGLSSVGTRIDIEHLAPTPVGMAVVAEARLDRVEGRRLTFSLTASDEVGQVGRGVHERYVIELGSFEKRLAARGRADTGTEA